MSLSVKRQENIVEVMADHVQLHQGMCDLLYLKRQQSCESAQLFWEKKITWLDVIITLVGDYAQNEGIPHFGGEHPGDTYYFSPLNIFILGLLCYGLDEILNAFIYHEDKGKKRGNNVVSMIVEFLRMNSIFENSDKFGPSEELNIVMENCEDQKKNFMVIRMCVWLV